MKRLLFSIILIFSFIASFSQQYVRLANNFLKSLDKDQRMFALYPFDTTERYNFHFFPKDDRKGLEFNKMSDAQRSAAFDLIRSCLSDNAVRKVGQIMNMENFLKAQEKRPSEDHMRDPKKYFITIFGIPSDHTLWGWRLEGHHITFNFTANNKTLVSGTPGFLGSNPAVVQEGPDKGLQILKEEAEKGFSLLNSLNSSQLSAALVDQKAPGEIITFVNRHAMELLPQGIKYNALDDFQKQKLLQLIQLYVNRYTKLLADDMMKEIQLAGLENLSFAWAGARIPGVGNPHYYRIQGPTFIIEYDNTQNNANHVHSVFRDLKNDFGDQLLQHYKSAH